MQSVDDTPPDSIRGEYEKHGASDYYSKFGATYRNPHESSVRRSIQLAIEKWRPDLFRVLDLAAGSGEATLALRERGAGRVDGIDPYTAEAYRQRTGRAAETFSFEDVAAGVLTGRAYTLVVCSFALHLCEPSRLPAVAYQLSLVAPALLILTPHKRPHLRPEWGWELVGENVVERVRSRFYQSNAGPSNEDPSGKKSS
jgi:SAM-dependent methyltransferase